MLKKKVNLKKRHYRIRKKVIGTTEVPRLTVFRSLAHLYVQAIDDYNGKTLLSLGTTSKEVKERVSYGGNAKAAEVLGELAAGKMQEKGITRVCFDRSGYQYHGRIKTLADTLRKQGIRF